ncbi:MAG: HEAT repeat domain-containing protein [Acidobacteriota bacterium]
MRYFYAFVCSVLICGCALAQDASDPKQRARAARDLVKLGSDAIPKLQAMLTDPDVDVRIEVVKAIVEVDTAASLDPLIQATRDNDPEVQIRATDGLVNFYLPGYVQSGLSAKLRRAGKVIKAKFTDTNDQVIGNYVQVRPEVVAALGKLARGGISMESRANAARAVGILRGRAALPDLYEALRSKDDQVIYESLNAIQKIRDPEAAPRIAFLLRDLNEKVQIAAIETTGLLQNRDALPQLREALTRARSTKVRRAALTAIAMLPDEGSRPIYQQYLNDKDDALRAAAAEGFARLRNKADLPVIEKAYAGEQKRNAQLSGAFALVMLGRTEISEMSPLQTLINTLNSSSWRGVSRAFLIELAREQAIRASLQQAVKQGTRDEKIELAQILAVSGDKDTVPVLNDLTHDSDTEVAQAALNAARTLKARLQ